jgi:hypothetical protein
MRDVHPCVEDWRRHVLPSLVSPRVIIEIGGVLETATIIGSRDDGDETAYTCIVESIASRSIPGRSGRVDRIADEIFPCFRPSFKPLARCPASATISASVTSPGNELTQSGSAAHEIDALIETTGADSGLPDATLVAIAVRYGVTLTEARDLERTILWHRSRLAEHVALGAQVSREFGLFVEIVPGLFLIGTVDRIAISADGRSAWIDDLKTGWGFVEGAAHNFQAACYIVAVAYTFPALDRIEFSFQYPRRPFAPESATATFLRHDVEIDIMPRVRSAALDSITPHPRFVTGTQCAECNGRAVCPVLHQHVVARVTGDDADVVRASIRQLSPDQRTALAADLIAAEAWAKAVRQAIRNAVEIDGVEVATPDGRVFANVERSNPTREIDLEAFARSTNLGEVTASADGVPFAHLLAQVGRVRESALIDAIKSAERESSPKGRLPNGRAAEIVDLVRTNAAAFGALVETPATIFTLVDRADLPATDAPSSNS